MNRQDMSAGIVRYVVEADGQVQVLVPYRLYRELLQFMRRRRVRASPDEVVADAVRAHLRGKATRRITA